MMDELAVGGLDRHQEGWPPDLPPGGPRHRTWQLYTNYYPSLKRCKSRNKGIVGNNAGKKGNPVVSGWIMESRTQNAEPRTQEENNARSVSG